MSLGLPDRYDELVALHLSEAPERRERLQARGRLILAIDGLQPDVGDEVLWVVREVLSREVLLARSLLSSAERELTPLLWEAVAGLAVPVVGAVSDGQHAVRSAIAAASPGLPHQLCHFHSPHARRDRFSRGGPAREEGAIEARTGNPPAGAIGRGPRGRGS